MNRVALSYRNEERARPYREALLAVGLEPVMMSPESPIQALDHCDGLLLSGGADLNPALYGTAPHPATSQSDDDRDHLEMQLISHASQKDLPSLCICRGMQILNVAFRGTLLQNIPNHLVRNRNDRGKPVHEIAIRGGTKLWAVVGEDSIEVNSRHHQAVGEMGAGLQVSAVAPDGTIEAIELSDANFILGVQWHPEDQFYQKANRRIFERFSEFVRAARSA